MDMSHGDLLRTNGYLSDQKLGLIDLWHYVTNTTRCAYDSGPAAKRTPVVRGRYSNVGQLQL
jgi:hypothetical protein